MKKLFILAFLLFATHSNVPAQLSKQEMRNDLEVFATTLPQKHLNLFAKLDKKDFEKKYPRSTPASIHSMKNLFS